MEEMKIATIVQLINRKAAEEGVTEKVDPENLVKLPQKYIYHMGETGSDVYAARVDRRRVCLVHVYPDGKVEIFFHYC